MQEEQSNLIDNEAASAIKESLRGREFSDSAGLLREDRHRDLSEEESAAEHDVQ
jgi:hypothetical protein